MFSCKLTKLGEGEVLLTQWFYRKAYENNTDKQNVFWIYLVQRPENL